MPDVSEEPDRTPGRRRRILVRVGLALAFVMVVLALLAIPLLSVPGDAEDSKAELASALEALQDDDLAAAQQHVDKAREHIDAAQDDTDGVGGVVWSALPVAGTPVADVRHLVDALEDAVSVAEIGVDLYPSVAGKDATLFKDKTLDLATLETVTKSVREAGAHLLDADESLDQVSGSTPLIGGRIEDKRDEAAAKVAPMAEAYTQLEPTLDDLPTIFGGGGEKTYLIAMLNPAELRFSGGATLAFAPMTWRDGKLDVGESLDIDKNPRLFDPIDWPKVEGNSFHPDGPLRMRNATLAPSWSVSGEELLRAWRSATGTEYDGVLAVDVVTMARLFALTGPVDVPGYGELTGDNLVQKLVASYDEYYPDPSVRDDLSAGVVPVFKDKLFDGGDYMAKGRILADAAKGRHLALYLHDPVGQEAVTALGLDGDLAEPDGDYLGVFTQNTNGSKVDYYQRRALTDAITLDSDGTAHHQLEVAVHNDTPPYAVPGTDPKSWYFTRWAGMALSTFVPGDAELEQVLIDGEDGGGRLHPFGDHQFLTRTMLLEPQQQTQVETSYQVPGAASADDGQLTYRLAVDPQGLVTPEQLTLTVTLPDGYTATSVPEGWTVDGDTLTFSTDALDASEDWEIVAEASD